MSKYITIDNVPSGWWAPERMPDIIEKVEKENPNYEFVQIVTSPGNGGYKEFIIMKLK